MKLLFLSLLRTNPSSLRHRVLKAGLWSTAGFGLSLFIRFGTNLLMSRLLVPDMFGVMAIATTIMIGLSMFSDVGLRQSVVQSPRGDEPSFLNTAWTIQVLRGMLIWLAAICVSIVIVGASHAGAVSPESVYAAPSLPYVVSALSFTTVIGGFESTKLYEASRGLALSHVTKLEIVAQIVGVGCMLGWVAVDRSIWALVAGAIGQALVRTILSQVWLPGTENRWEWNRSAVHEVVHFGKWIFVATILGFLVNSGDRLLLGVLVNSTVLGFYSIASLIASSLEGMLSKIMGDVSFPAFSEVVRERRSDLQRTYYQFLGPIGAVAYFSAGFLMMFGQTLISLLYDRRYDQVGWMLELVSSILLTIPFRLATQSFLALGMPKLQSHIVLIRLVFLFLVTPVAFHFFGLVGALIGIVLSHFTAVPIIIFYNIRLGLFSIRKESYLLLFVAAGLAAGMAMKSILGSLIIH
jgi:O-antigen/teichoic acid export membrane protein